MKKILLSPATWGATTLLMLVGNTIASTYYAWNIAWWFTGGSLIGVLAMAIIASRREAMRDSDKGETEG